MLLKPLQVEPGREEAADQAEARRRRVSGWIDHRVCQYQQAADSLKQA